RAPSQRHAVHRQDLLEIRSSYRRRKCGGIVAKIAVWVIRKRLEKRGEIVARQVSMKDEDRSLVASAFPECTDCRGHWRKRIVSFRRTIVRDSYELRRRRQRHLASRALQKR